MICLAMYRLSGVRCYRASPSLSSRRARVRHPRLGPTISDFSTLQQNDRPRSRSHKKGRGRLSLRAKIARRDK